MGDKKMLQKERKTCSQKKPKKAIVVPRSWNHIEAPPFWCPSLGPHWNNQATGLGGTSKSWISSSSPSACCIHDVQAYCPQLVVNFSPKQERRFNSCPRDNVPFYMESGYLAITGVSSPAFAFFKRDPDDYYGSWITRDCGNLEFTNLIEFQRKYYTISRKGTLALIEEEGNSGNFEITAFGRDRVVPRCKVSKHFREYLLECNGEIYLVFLLSRKLIHVVDGVEVFRLDTSRLSWEKVDRLKGDDIFFLRDDSCLGISTRRLLRSSKGSNCVYFTQCRAKGTAWFVYDMETSCISPTSGPEVDYCGYNRI